MKIPAPILLSHLVLILSGRYREVEGLWSALGLKMHNLRSLENPNSPACKERKKRREDIVCRIKTYYINPQNN